MRKKNLFTLLIFAAVNFIAAQTFPVTKIWESTYPEHAINLVFLGDGYTAGEMNKFRSDVQKVVDSVFTEPPFMEYRNFFNVFAIEVPSNESGTSFDCNEDCRLLIPRRDTYFRTQFWWNGHQRLLYYDNAGWTNLINVLIANTPTYDYASLIVNSNSYGGAGGTISTFSTNSVSVELFRHEFGHSFADLIDEYWWEPNAREGINMTRQTNQSLVKWRNWLGNSFGFNVGLFPHGTTENTRNWFKPTTGSVCKMEQLGSLFCPVCTEGIIEKIYMTVEGPITDFSPDSKIRIDDGESQDFIIDLLYPSPNTLRIAWTLNGSPVVYANDSRNLTLNAEDLNDGQNVLTATVFDETPLLRGMARSNIISGNILPSLSNQTVTWNIGVGEEDDETSVRRPTNVNRGHGILLENSLVSDFARISVITPEPVSINLRILDNLGNVVHTAETQCLRTQSQTPCEVVWNLSNAAGRFVGGGSYLIVVEASGISGRTYLYSARIGVKR